MATAIARQPSAFGPLATWLRLIAREGYLDSGYWARALFVTLVSSLSAPLRWWEEFRHRDLLEHAPIPHPPIFILGHWRSGTTALHYLLHGSRFGVVSRPRRPGLSLTSRRATRGWSRPRPDPPDGRPAISAETPRMSWPVNLTWSSTSSLAVPARRHTYFDSTVLFKGAAPTLKAWRAVYLRLLRVATEISGGRRLVLRVPHTAHHELRRCFPGRAIPSTATRTRYTFHHKL
jgi:hypothetical protein